MSGEKKVLRSGYHHDKQWIKVNRNITVSLFMRYDTY